MGTDHVLETIGYPTDGHDFEPVSPYESRECYILSRKNKISSQYLHSLAASHELDALQTEWKDRQHYQNRYTSTLENLAEVMPETVKYALVKSAHGFLADSKDIDLLVFDDELELVKTEFIEAGYEFCGDSPSSFDVLDPETDIQLDVQNGFTLQRVSYFDEAYVRPRVQLREYRSVELPIIARPDDLALIVVHSITEQMFLLKEYYAAVCMLESFSDDEFRQFMNTVDENRLGSSCRSFFSLVDELSNHVFDRQPQYVGQILDRYGSSKSERQALRKSDFKTPHHYLVRTGLSAIASKLRHRAFLQSALGQIPRLVDPRVSYHILSNLLTRRKREHYVHDAKDIEDAR